MTPSTTRPMIYLDRDGTINEDFGYVYQIDQWRFLEGAVEALQLFQANDYALAVVTNQSGIARGMFTDSDVWQLHDFMRQELSQFGVVIDAIAICPHGAQDGCACRKPATGLVDIVRQTVNFSIDESSSWMIGDKPSDIGFGQAIGAKTALLSSRYWDPDGRPTADLYGETLLEAAKVIVSGEPSSPVRATL